MPTNFRQTPGLYSGPSITSRNIFTSLGVAAPRYAPSVYVVDGGLSRDPGNSPVSLLRAGLLMGKITASNKLRPSVIGLTSLAILGTTAGGTASIYAGTTTVTEIARLITAAAGNVNVFLAGPPSAGGTINLYKATVSAASGTTMTMTGATNATALAFVSQSVIMPGDGSSTSLFILDDTLYGKDMTDINGSNIDQLMGRTLLTADLIASQIINLTADTVSGTATDSSVENYLKSFLKAGGNNNVSGVNYTFDDDRNVF